MSLSIKTVDPERILSLTADPFIMPEEFVFPDLNFDDENGNISLDSIELVKENSVVPLTRNRSDLMLN